MDYFEKCNQKDVVLDGWIVLVPIDCDNEIDLHITMLRTSITQDLSKCLEQSNPNKRAANSDKAMYRQ